MKEALMASVEKCVNEFEEQCNNTGIVSYDTTIAAIDGNGLMHFYIYPTDSIKAHQCFVINRYKDDNGGYVFTLNHIDECGRICYGCGNVEPDYSILLMNNGRGEYYYILKKGLKTLYHSLSFTECIDNNNALSNTWRLLTKCIKYYHGDEIELFCKLAERDKTVLFIKDRMASEGFFNRMTDEEKNEYGYLLNNWEQ